MGNRLALVNNTKYDGMMVEALAVCSEATLTSSIASIPIGAKGFRIFSTTNTVYFGVDITLTTANHGALASPTASKGICKAGAWDYRLLAEGSSSLHVTATSSTAVDIEFF
jgi:hypothetical protein